MLAYAANVPRTAQRTGSPKALTLILAGHALVLAGVLTAKPELITRDEIPIIDVFNVPAPPPKPQTRVEQQQRPVTQDSFIETERPTVDMERSTSIALGTGPTFEDIGTVIGSGPSTLIDPPRHDPARIAARFITPENAMKPPYPTDKLRAEEEATLKLKLTIDAHGNVIAVDPVGSADASFLAAARRHILKAWHYKPATEDGIAVPSSTVISLAFRLEDV